MQTHFEQIDLAVCVVVILQAVKRVVVSVTVDRAHSWTWEVGAVEIATMTHAGEMSNRTSAEMIHLSLHILVIWEGERAHTICDMAFPRFLQASIPGPARHRGSFLGSSSDLGAAPALADKPHLKEEVRNDKTHQLIPYCRKSISKSCE